MPPLRPPLGSSSMLLWRVWSGRMTAQNASFCAAKCPLGVWTMFPYPPPKKTEIFGPQIGIESWTTEKNQILKTLAIGLLSRAWWIFLQRIAMGLHGQSYNLPPTNPRWRMAAILIIFVNRLYHRTGWWRYLHKTKPRGDGHVTKNGSGS